MRVLELRSENLMASAPTRLALPRAGVVVVTGENGEGKSSLIETVAVALFGRTLRGTPWWPNWKKVKGETPPTSVAEVVTDLVRSKRMRSAGNGKTSLAWEVNGDEDAGRVLLSTGMLSGGAAGFPSGEAETRVVDAGGITYETATQAQAALEEVIGAFDPWRRCSVVSSDDAAHFSSATDGERKRLLEGLLGLEKFDAALDACRRDYRSAEGKLNDQLRSLEAARGRLAAAQARASQHEAELARAREAVSEESPAPPPASDVRELEVGLREARAEQTRAEARYQQASRAHARAEVALESAQRTAEKFASGQCPTCGGSVVDLCQKHEETEAGARRALEAAASAVKAAKADVDEAKWVVEGLASRWHAARAEAQQAELKAVARARALMRVDQVEREAESLQAAVSAADADVAACEGAVGHAKRDVQKLRAVESVLGLRGFRAHVLASSLEGLSAVANAWLPRLGLPALRVALRPYTEKKSGGVADAISLDIEGAGDGYGYRATSGGERRRVDVALLLALAEVGQAAAGLKGSTLFLDEVFDKLDEAGIGALSAVLEDLSRDRCVFLISHNQDLITGVRATMRVHVEGGVAHVLGSNAPASPQGSTP